MRPLVLLPMCVALVLFAIWMVAEVAGCLASRWLALLAYGGRCFPPSPRSGFRSTCLARCRSQSVRDREQLAHLVRDNHHGHPKKAENGARNEDREN
jgi:hypothetical protein